MVAVYVYSVAEGRTPDDLHFRFHVNITITSFNSLFIRTWVVTLNKRRLARVMYGIVLSLYFTVNWPDERAEGVLRGKNECGAATNQRVWKKSTVQTRRIKAGFAAG